MLKGDFFGACAFFLKIIDTGFLYLYKKSPARQWLQFGKHIFALLINFIFLVCRSTLNLTQNIAIGKAIKL
ncbi:hypothetical protein COV49_00400 [Candidatus Falkowbacteria bacterium CG11_big_fil_rev_8_21_14_0_20_39_10]|uniref:Uncharacterized protein n=1 Tax=Candidatus Falkowbacteria bacterium CG11_big_fil_rev_8_21_14_0_20_39_10 TaxID=1974570 RepID=A0A2M6KA00_9BACT|nr:MAG: hypothetical protein COV49_00400 [Candidatus Falkowbacteria bacterium CG11_big_fil_rev_8_21_14_0_20_39_10]